MKNLLKAILVTLLVTNTAFAMSEFNDFLIGPTFQDKVEPAYLHYQLKPGESVEDYLTVKNRSATNEITIYLDGVDSERNEKNELAFKTSNKERTEFGAWVKLDAIEVALKPGESKNIKFTIKVPENAEKKDYVGGLSGLMNSKTEETGMIKSNFRVVVRTFIKVTDNPQEIEKMPLPGPSINQIYFYVSTGIFAIAILIFLVFTVKNRKKAKVQK